MEAVKAGASYDLIDPVDAARSSGQLDARDVWDKMIHGAWRTGEPGVFFIDEANRYNPVPHLGAYEATNPCGEQPLLPYDVCNLGSINVGYYVQRRRDGLGRASGATSTLSTHFLDNIIDVNKYPLPEIDALSKRIRRIGLGVMGFADVLVRLGIPYDTRRRRGVRPPGHGVRRRRGEEGERAARRTSAGRSPSGRARIWGPDETCARDANGKRIRPMQLLRNCNVTTVAPTGTISHHRRLLVGPRAAVRRCVHAQPGRRDDAGRERGLRRHREARRLVLRRADGAHREDRARPLRRSAREVAARVRHGERHRA